MGTDMADDSIPAAIDHLWPTQLVLKRMQHAAKLIKVNLSPLHRNINANSKACTNVTYCAVCSSRTITTQRRNFAVINTQTYTQLLKSPN